MGTKMMEKTAASAGKKANLSMKQYGMMLALIAVYVIFAFITEGKNLSAMNVNSLIMQNGYVVILAVGMLLCVLTGNVDLGVGSVVASCGAVAGTLIVDFGVNTPLAMLASLVVGALFGVFVGFFVSKLDIPPSLSPWPPCLWAAASATLFSNPRRKAPCPLPIPGSAPASCPHGRWATWI